MVKAFLTAPRGARGALAALRPHGRARELSGSEDDPPVEEIIRGRRAEQRVDERERLRLRSAKLLDGSYRFVCECLICDRSRNGLRLRLARSVRLRLRMAVHIDETGEIRAMRVAWRQGLTIGARLHERAPFEAIKPWDRIALRKRYYGIPG